MSAKCNLTAGNDLRFIKRNIEIKREQKFNNRAPGDGILFYVARFVAYGPHKTECYNVTIDNLDRHGEEVCRKSVLDQVIARHFTVADPQLN